MPTYVLAIDQGTTSSRAILFDAQRAPIATAQKEFAQHFPRSGWVEHNPEDIWSSVVATCREAMTKAHAEPRDIAAIGITNQRETTLVWDRDTGKPIYPAIVWQDRRTAEACAALKRSDDEQTVTMRTGLLLDSYFSATKIAWILDRVDGAREAAKQNRLAFGTVDTFLLWRLTGGRVHATDATNASRTMLYDIHAGCWSDEMLDLFNIPASILPSVFDCAADFGETDPVVFGGAIPIAGIAGDQQAATIGQACFQPGMMKATYGTGCFALLNTGAKPVHSTNRLLTTIAYQLKGCPTYALEGSIFIAGAAVQWLRDGLKIIGHAEQSNTLAVSADPHQEVFLVPAFVGLGAPHWDPEARGALFGMTRNTGPAEIARAALESVGFQTRDLLEAMRSDWAGTTARTGHDATTILRVDGGMTASNWTMQFLSDILDAAVDRPHVLETTAVGAAYLAGMHRDIYPGFDEFAKSWALERRFHPNLEPHIREARYTRWRNVVKRTLST
jgi:glycerol kinase